MCWLQQVSKHLCPWRLYELSPSMAGSNQKHRSNPSRMRDGQSFCANCSGPFRLKYDVVPSDRTPFCLQWSFMGSNPSIVPLPFEFFWGNLSNRTLYNFTPGDLSNRTLYNFTPIASNPFAMIHRPQFQPVEVPLWCPLNLWGRWWQLNKLLNQLSVALTTWKSHYNDMWNYDLGSSWAICQ